MRLAVVRVTGCRNASLLRLFFSSALFLPQRLLLNEELLDDRLMAFEGVTMQDLNGSQGDISVAKVDDHAAIDVLLVDGLDLAVRLSGTSPP